ncbi:MAG: hypothetical protein Q4E01_04020 [Actinomycetaceae bacterium]|nr:hypothetical protein [Actinomycetaceae bacterium]
MVASVIGLKLRSLWNNLTHPIWKLILAIFLTLYFGAYLVFLLLASLLWIEPEHLEMYELFTLFTSAMVTLFWFAGPLFGMGLDATVSPKSFAPYTAPSKKLSRAILYASLFGFGGFATFFLYVIATTALFTMGQPLHGVLAIVLIPIALISLALVSRFVASWFYARVEQSKRRRDISQIFGAIAFVALIWSLSLISNTLDDGGIFNQIGAINDVLKWTPLPGIITIPHLLALGETIPAAMQAIYGALILAGLGIGWHKIAVKEMIGTKTDITDEVRAAIASGRHQIVDAPETIEGVEGLEAQLKTLNRWLKLGVNPTRAAIIARTLHDWVHDARLVPSLLIGTLLPLFGFGLMYVQPDMMGLVWFLFLFAPVSLGQTSGMLVSYDSTAFWMHVSAGVTGRDDRFGRFIGSQPVLIPVAIVNGVLGSFVLDLPFSPVTFALVSYMIAVLSAALMSLLTSYRTLGVQAPGTSSLSTKGASNQFATMGAMLLVTAVTALLLLPALLGYIYLTPIVTEVGVTALAFVWTLGISYLTLRIASVWFERNQARILQQIKSWPGH